MTSLKRHIAASGFTPEEITLTGTTFDEIRPGCWQVPERLADMDINGVQAQLCFPNYPLCGPDLPSGAGTRSSPSSACTYNDWMVEEWCGGSGGRLLRLCIVPLWDVEPAPPRSVATARRAGGRAHRAAGVPRPPEHPQRLLGAVLCRVRGDVHRHLSAHRIGDEDAADVVGRNRCRARVADLRQQCGEPRRLPVLRRVVPPPESQAAVRRGADRLDPVRARARRRRVDHAPVERWSEELPRAAEHLLLPTGLQLLLQGSDRREDARPDRRRPRRVRDRLPALRQHLAAL